MGFGLDRIDGGTVGVGGYKGLWAVELSLVSCDVVMSFTISRKKKNNADGSLNLKYALGTIKISRTAWVKLNRIRVFYCSCWFPPC